MQFSTKTTALSNTPTSCLILGVYLNGNMPEETAAVDKASGKAISKLLKAGDISGKAMQAVLMQNVAGIKAKRVLLLGCGKKSDFSLKKFTEILRLSVMQLNRYSLEDAVLGLATLPMDKASMERKANQVAKVFTHAEYRYKETVSKAKPAQIIKRLAVACSTSERSQTKKGLDAGAAVGIGMNTARNLGNLPANICTPTYLGDHALALAKKNKLLKTKVLSEAQMKRLGMHSLLSVGHGSDQPSVLIVMEYKGSSANTKPNVIVGKGITFDTGGISLKPGSAMDEMKYDMCGAASVMGTMHALCELKPKINVVAIIASAENMPSGRATKPGDVVTSMSGQTIEVLNTDAEGRLVLCDALTYAKRFNPKTVVDIATLTGACVATFGNVVTGLLSNDDELADKLYQCGMDSLDPAWRLPLWDEYQKLIDSNFADIANIGGPRAGTITAGCFLARFTKEYKWAHLDIAGTAWNSGQQKGATGRPVPLLMEYLLNA
ncbi:MAG: leucyl aminopeptidase [Gammaproteobacteria bacterium]|jgi:leucyl aminopeptidase|nr:leucyl aminopeptidase [Gammaproteobacteria bacterium]